MKKTFLALVILLGLNVQAHSGPHITGTSIFDKAYKYKINTADGHIGHFYIKKARVSRKANERLRVEHTIHLETDIVKKFNINYKEKTGLISYDYDMDGFRYFFNFYIQEDLLEVSNPGSMTIFNKSDNSFTVANVTLDAVLESDSQGNEAGEHGHSN